MSRDQETNDLKSVLSTPAGRRFVWRQLAEAGVFRTSFVPLASDSTAYNEGRRSLGIALLAEITTETPHSYLLMQQEEIDNEQQRKELSKNDQSCSDHYDGHRVD